MKKFIQSILTIIISFTIMLALTLLLDMQFFKDQTVRQMLVYWLMVIVCFLQVRIIILINNNG